jgi:hypothetical protein
MPPDDADPVGPVPSRPWAARAVGLAALAFGLATVGGAGLVLFGPEPARVAAGRTVPFVVWGNFLLGFAYVAAGAGLALGRRWAGALAAAIASATGLLALGLGAHVLSGGAFEPRTPWALLVRAGLWAGVAAWARRISSRR